MENESITLQDILSKIKSPLEEVKKIFTFYYAPKYFKVIKKAFIQVNGLYYKKIRENINIPVKRYNFENIQRVFLFTGMLLDGYNLSKKKMNPESAIYLLLSALFYDASSIEDINENGDKGTRINRSIQFLKRHTDDFLIGEEDADIIGRLIRFTGNMTDDEFFSMSDDEKIAGSILGTAYFIERLTDEFYPENLLLLYDEFNAPVSAELSNGIGIAKKAAEFYEVLKVKLADYARFHFRYRYQVDGDLFAEKMDVNINRLYDLIDGNDQDLLERLKRIDFIKN